MKKHNSNGLHEKSNTTVKLLSCENKFFKELELTKYRRGIDTRIEPHIINAYDLDTPFYEEVTKGIKICG